MNNSQFYTKFARVIAGIALILGIIGVVLGLVVATGVMVEPEPGHYLGSKTSGESIDRGIVYIFLAVTLGVLTEISQSLFNEHNTKQDN